jgi:hypothetical protein
MKKTKKHSSSFARYWVALTILVIVAGGLIYGFRYYDKPTSTVNTKQTGGVDKLPTAQNNYQSGNGHSSSSSSSSQGGAIDQNGQTSTSTSTNSQGVSSTSNAITLQQPIANSTLISGDTISGTATVSSVDYRILDDANGQLAQGTLNVVNGSFSGILQFQIYSNSTTGQLDVYSYDANGAEINNISIPINF